MGNNVRELLKTFNLYLPRFFKLTSYQRDQPEKLLQLLQNISFSYSFQLTPVKSFAWVGEFFHKPISFAFATPVLATDVGAVNEFFSSDCGKLIKSGQIEDIKNRRLDELMDVLEEVEGKVIIWANYIYDI